MSIQSFKKALIVAHDLMATALAVLLTYEIRETGTAANMTVRTVSIHRQQRRNGRAERVLKSSSVSIVFAVLQSYR